MTGKDETKVPVPAQLVERFASPTPAGVVSDAVDWSDVKVRLRNAARVVDRVPVVGARGSSVLPGEVRG